MKLFLLYFFLLFSTLSNAQHIPNKKQVDSLTTLLKTSKSDSVKTRIAFLLSDHWSYSDSIKSKQYLLQGAKTVGTNSYLKAVYAFYEANYLFDVNPEKASKKFLESEKMFSKFSTTESYKFRARAWRSYGILLQLKNNEKGMMETIQNKAIPLAEKANARDLVGIYYTDIGMVLMNQLLYKQAEEKLQKAEEILENTKADLDRLLVAKIYRARTLCFLKQPKQAKVIIDQTDKLLQKRPLSDIHLDNLLNKSLYYRMVNQNEKAAKILKEGIQIAENLGNTIQKNSLQYQLYKVYTELNQYNNALDALKKTYNNKVYDFTEEQAMFSYEFSNTYEKLNDYKNAYLWQKKYSTIRDTMYAKNLKEEIAKTELKFNNTVKEKKILQLESEKKEALLKQKNQNLLNWLLGIGICVFFLALIFLGFLYRNHKRNSKFELKEIQQEKKLQLVKAMMEGEETERQRIARDLHDGLGGTLSGIKIKLSGQQNPKMNPVLDETIHQLEKSIDELRRISRNMMPETLVRSGLKIALVDLQHSLTTQDTKVELQTNDFDANMELNSQVNIYRIVQELLINSIKHGEAKHVLIQCIQNEKTFFITIEDNGKGFDPSKTPISKGIGLENVKNRVTYLNGKIDIDSAINQGTTINIEVYV